MTIKFVKDAKPSVESGETNIEMTPDSLKFSGVHLFLRSHEWDSITIELTDDIPTGTLKYIHMCTDNLILKFSEPVSDHVIRLLCDIYPNKSGALRKAQMLKGDIHAVLS